jgi:cytochrome c oxidase subunit 2
VKKHFIFFLLIFIQGGANAASPMDFLWTQSASADPVTRLNWGLIAISVVVVVIIAGLVLHACLRKRPPLSNETPDKPARPLSSETSKSGMSWIYIGVGISTVVLLISTVWTLKVLYAVAAPSHPNLTVEVIAHEWWWEVRYPGTDASQTVVTANEIHIPVGEPVHIRLQSDDVIHSFWVPKLGGKTDVIPGQTNYNWVQADHPGVYRGQCAEFCGPQHAHMAFYVVAQNQLDFNAWRKNQLRASSALPATQQILIQGKDTFLARCSVCHTIRGTTAQGTLGPDLTHLMSRKTIAAGMLPNTTASLSGWIANAQSVKPNVRMPSFSFTPQELHALVDYLQTLQ